MLSSLRVLLLLGILFITTSTTTLAQPLPRGAKLELEHHRIELDLLSNYAQIPIYSPINHIISEAKAAKGAKDIGYVHHPHQLPQRKQLRYYNNALTNGMGVRQAKV